MSAIRHLPRRAPLSLLPHARAVHTSRARGAGTAAATAPNPSPPPPPPLASQPSAQLYSSGRQPRAVSSQGRTFTLSDGRTILDGMSGGAAVACIGASNPDVVNVLAKQAALLPYAWHQSLGNDASEALAAWLTDRSDGALVAAAFLNSGSEAIDTALKIVRQYWLEEGEPQREYIIARNPSYHGNTLAGLGVGNVASRRSLYAPYIPDTFQHVSTPQLKRSGMDETAYVAQLAAELEAKITSLGPANVAAFLAEPVVGSSVGVMPPPRGYFPAMAAVCAQHNILFIMDEVMCGTGRSGTMFAHQAVCEGVVPDVLTMAKGLGGGYVTISGVLVGPRVADVINAAGQWKSSQTYQNHPVNCAVALAVVQKIERLLPNVVDRSGQILGGLRASLEDVPQVYDIRGQGLFIAVEFDVPSDLAPRFASRVKSRAFENGLLTLPVSGGIDGVNGEAIVLAPAYNTTEDEAARMVEILSRSINECLAEL